jgi:hypothetical protein
VEEAIREEAMMAAMAPREEMPEETPSAMMPDETGGTMTGSETSRTPLLAEDELQTYRQRWEALQVRFVDQPRDSVEGADELVSDLVERLSKVFADERASLESQWEEGTDASTEDLRIAIQRYRSFFDRLLAA